jgi:hypothetical protein
MICRSLTSAISWSAIHKNALLQDGSKSDRIDARKLAELLRGNLHP